MKVHIKVTKIEDSLELECFLMSARKLRESIYTCSNDNFTMEINTKLKV
jgi:hypothetical protein